MIKLENIAKISAALLLSLATLAAAQDRPAPESAPILDLPVEVEETGDSASPIVETREDDLESPAFETVIEVIVGDSETKMVRWPSKR